MKTQNKKFGVTLPEMIVAITIVTVMVSLAMPAVKSLYSSMGNSPAATKSMISAALASAKAIAVKNQRYAGIRFQKIYRPDGDILNADQYMIFIEHDKNKTDLANGFYAVEGINPAKLPNEIGVMDLIVNPDGSIANECDPSNTSVTEDILNRTTFSIIFSPSGKLVIHDVRVVNRNGRDSTNSDDDIFNTYANVTAEYKPVGMFIQDNDGFCVEEQSRRSFIFYNREELKKASIDHAVYSDYLHDPMHETIFINRYTGTIINREN